MKALYFRRVSVSVFVCEEQTAATFWISRALKVKERLVDAYMVNTDVLLSRVMRFGG